MSATPGPAVIAVTAVATARWLEALRRPGARRRDTGSGTVVAVGVLGVVLTVTVAALLVVSAVIASHRAQAAADLSALAGAVESSRGAASDRSCDRAAEVATRNGATLRGCVISADLSVQVSVLVPASVPRVGVAVASARAGPGP